MFLDSSRYAKVGRVDVRTAGGRTVSALTLRRLPTTSGEPYVVNDSDRLDVLAQRVDGDATRWWRVADANTALDAGQLTEQMGTVIKVPSA